MTNSDILSRVVELAVTYLMQSTVFLSVAWCMHGTVFILSRRNAATASNSQATFFSCNHSLVEQLWKLAAVLALMTAPVSVFSGWGDPVWRWSPYDQFASKIESVRSTNRVHQLPPQDNDRITGKEADRRTLSSEPLERNAINRVEWNAAAEQGRDGTSVVTGDSYSSLPMGNLPVRPHQNSDPAQTLRPIESATELSASQYDRSLVETRIGSSIDRWIRGAALVLLAWLGCTALRLAYRILVLSRLLARCEPIIGDLRLELDRVIPKGGTIRLLRRSADARLGTGSEHGDCSNEPFACGIFRWTIVLPDWIERELSPAEAKALLAHEVAHLCRRDPLWLLVGEMLCTCLAFQPLNFVARNRWQQATEFLCDDWAVGHSVSPITLAHCLTRIAEQRLAGRVVSGGLAARGGASSLTPRIEWLLRSNRDTVHVRGGTPMLSSLLMVAAGFFAVACSPHISFVPTVEACDVPADRIEWMDIEQNLRQVLDELDQIQGEVSDDPEVSTLLNDIRSKVAGLKRRVGQ